jgi:hypothetical protein
MVCMVIKKNRLPGTFQLACVTAAAQVFGFNGQTNVNVIAELANGKTIIGRALWTVNVQEVESEDAVLMFAGKVAK